MNEHDCASSVASAAAPPRSPPWAVAPLTPPQRTPLYRFLRPPPGGELRVMCVSCEPYAVWCHWHNQRTRPCRGDALCELCDAGAPRFWCCWISALQARSLDQVGVSLTARGLAYLAPAEDGVPAWRGRIFRLVRCGAAANAPVKIVREPFSAPKAPLPEPADLATALAILWGAK